MRKNILWVAGMAPLLFGSCGNSTSIKDDHSTKVDSVEIHEEAQFEAPMLQSIVSPIQHENPVFTSFNGRVAFSSIEPASLLEAADLMIAKSRKDIDSIVSISPEQRTFANTMVAYDDVLDQLEQVISVGYLLDNTSPNEELRKAGNESFNTIVKYETEISLNEGLYTAILDYSKTTEYAQLSGWQKRFVDKELESFKKNGFALDAEKRAELKILKDGLTELTSEFDKNINESKDTVVFNRQDLDGMNEEYIKSRKQGANYVLNVKNADFKPFMKFATSDAARKRMYFKRHNKAIANVEVLDKIITERTKLAKLLGYDTYAAYSVSSSMSKTPKTVWDFENNLVEKVKVKAKVDYEELLEVKRGLESDASISVVQEWEWGFLKNILLKDKYSLDQEAIKAYFEVNAVRDGIFAITKDLFGVEIRKVEGAEVWQKDVEFYEAFEEDGSKIGSFYLDIFSRADKYDHYMCQEVITGKKTANGDQLPVAALLCTFPVPTETQPSLLSLSDVEYFFHEFGHVLHHVLAKTQLNSQSAFGVSGDFVEAPSQIYENWVYNYDAVKLISKHHETGAVMPTDLFDKIVAAKNVGSGLSAARQLKLGLVDFTLYDKYTPGGEKSSRQVLEDITNEVTLFPYLENTNYHAAFGHLNGYAANYYGYMWSNVFASDMYSVFEKNGVTDRTTGMRYRNLILKNGAKKDENEIVKDFLEREPNQAAFLKSLGL